MGYLIIRTLDHLMFEQLLDAFKAKGVTARQGDWLFVIMIIFLKAYSAFKHLFHCFVLIFEII